MTLFIVICAVLVALAVIAVLWPLLRAPAPGAESVAPRSTLAAVIVAALLPLAAFGLYFWASNWSWNPPPQGESLTAPNLRELVALLKDRLSRQPEDLEGWKLLGRSAAVLGDYPLSRQAFGEAYTRSKGADPAAVVGYAEALVLNDEREIDGQAAELFERALTLAPGNSRALWYGGFVAYRRGDFPLAQQRWLALQGQELQPELRRVLDERLADVARAQGQEPPPAAGSAAPAAAAIPIRIDIAPSLAAQATAGQSLFLIARRGEGGPPLAVVRRAVGSWPLELSMSDANAMLPGISLVGGGPIRLIARISKKGEPIAASGDLIGEVEYDFSSASPVLLTIDRIVP